jgi:hypothetical protein
MKQVDIVKSAAKKINEIDIIEIQYLSEDLKKSLQKEVNDIKKILEKIEAKLNA